MILWDSCNPWVSHVTLKPMSFTSCIPLTHVIMSSCSLLSTETDSLRMV